MTLRYTTPTHVFKFGIPDGLEISKIRIDYAQDHEIRIRKTMDDGELSDDGKTFSVHLSQDDTAKLSRGSCTIQAMLEVEDVVSGELNVIGSRPISGYVHQSTWDYDMEEDDD